MGECGCGETRPHKIFQVGKNVMVVEIYPGCHYCDTGIMVSLQIMTPKEAKVWDWKPTEKFQPDENSYEIKDFPIISKEDLVEAVRAIGGDDEFTDFLEDEGLNILQKALSIRMKKTAKSEKQHARS